MPKYGLELQLEIYESRKPPGLPVSFEEWEAEAREVMESGAYGYVAGGAGAEDTMRANREAFYRWHLRPRMLRDVDERDLSTTVLGTRSAAPFMLAPVGVLSIVHEEADLAVARTAASLGIPMVLSTVSSFTIEEVAEEMGDSPRWFQLYPGRSNEVMASMLHRAEAAGYSAVVATLDTTMLGFRERDLKHAYFPFLHGEGIANYLSDPAFRERLDSPPEEDLLAAARAFLDVYVNPSLSWKDIEFIRSRTSLPILLKGITHPEDARIALEHDVQGIIVSNHGGRQVDGAVAALDALPEVSEAVGDRVPVLLDSGVRRGADVLKALALGASAVLVGRPYVYGLAVGGEAGARQVVRNLIADVDLELALSGRRSVEEVDRSLVTRVEP
ncbi:lactate 2-monooxygenase [soil metagenome]